MVFHGGISLKRTLSLKKKKQIAAALAAAVFVCGGCTGNLKEEQDEILLETVAESSENLEHADDAEQSEAGETLPETAEPQETAETRLGSTIYVHVCGHVKYPGVYQMQEGSRVYEAIDPSAPNICLKARRPIRPNPLIATLTAILNSS